MPRQALERQKRNPHHTLFHFLNYDWQPEVLITFFFFFGYTTKHTTSLPLAFFVREPVTVVLRVREANDGLVYAATISKKTRDQEAFSVFNSAPHPQVWCRAPACWALQRGPCALSQLAQWAAHSGNNPQRAGRGCRRWNGSIWWLKCATAATADGFIWTDISPFSLPLFMALSFPSREKLSGSSIAPCCLRSTGSRAGLTSCGSNAQLDCV